uniref:Uncharacterized protein n=1 Tax=Avena sativa TaxID=4498 RepID=A0ACD5W5G2_AVESA
MELSAATLLFLSLISLVILVSLLGLKSSKKKLPPGPRPLPFIGNLLHLLTSEPQIALWNLAKKHGPVMYLRLGHVDTVVISSPAAAQEVLRDKDLIFASRPRMLATDIILDGMDLAYAPYSAYWRKLRKLCMTGLLGAHKVRQLAPLRDRETLSLVRKVGAAGQGGELVNLGSLLVPCSIAITWKATLGQVCGGELLEQFMSVVNVAVTDGAGFCAADLFPSLWFVDVVTGLRGRLKRARRQLDQVFAKITSEHEARLEEGKKTVDEDLLSAMLRMKDDPELEIPITAATIQAVTFDMLIGGTETTSSSAEWVMSELMRNPEAMAKAQAEVRRTLDGKSPRDHERHMDKLRYTRMVIKESMRLHPALPLLIPRLCTETCDIGGFEVVKGTKVIVNAWAVARSPEHWHDADKFRPERFEDSAADYKGLWFEYIPFGSGRRMCPGDAFGLAVLELMVVRLLYYFDWSLPCGMKPRELDMDMVVGATARRRNHLKLVASPYKQLAAEI